MSRVSTLLVLVALTTPVSSQTLLQTFQLSDGNPSSSDRPFGVLVEPDGVHAIVPLAGELLPFSQPPSASALFNNDQVLRIDLVTGAVVDQATVGLYPDDPCITTNANGQIRHYFVTNSTDGSVTVLDPTFTPIATVALTPCFGATFFSVFPFGIAASPDSSRVVVTTIGCGDIAVIDSDPASPNFLDVTSYPIGGTFGRPVWLDSHTIACPHNLCDATFTWCITGLLVLDLTAPAQFQSIPESAPTPFLYESGTDCALLPNGRVLITVGFGVAPRLTEFGPDSVGQFSITRSLDLSPHVGVGLHGLGVDSSGTLAVTTSTTSQGELAFIDIPSFTVLSVRSTNTAGVAIPNEVAFTPDDTQIVVTVQQLEELRIYDDLPGLGLALTGTPSVGLGGVATLTLDGITRSREAFLFVSLAGNGPQVFGAVTLRLSDPYFLFASVVGDALGDATISIQVPMDPALSGLQSHWQAATLTASGALRVSNGFSISVL